MMSRSLCCSFERMGRRIEKIAAELADIFEERRAMGLAFVPKSRSRELSRENDGATDGKRAADGADAARRMIERQRHIHTVAARGARDGRESVGQDEKAQMADIGGLGQARRAARVDVEAFVLRRHAIAERRVEQLGREAGKLHIEIHRALDAGTGRPHRHRPAHQILGARIGWGELRPENEMLRARNTQRMGERLATQIAVDERGDARRSSRCRARQRETPAGSP